MSNSKPWYARETSDAVDALDSSSDGLSKDEVRSRQEKYGPNTVRQQKQVSAWKILLNQFTSPLIYVLFGALIVTLSIKSWSDAIVIDDPAYRARTLLVHADVVAPVRD